MIYTLCSIDWTAVGTWIGSLAVIATACIAWWQLRSLNKNERVRNTLLLWKGYHEPFVTNLLTISPSQATGEAAVILEHPEAVDAYNKREGWPFLTVEAKEQKDRLELYVQVIVNYFSPISDLIEHKSVEATLVYSQLELAIELGYRILTTVTFVEGVDLEPMERLMMGLAAYKQQMAKRRARGHSSS